MRQLYLLGFVLLSANGFADEQAYQQCVRTYLPRTELDAAAVMVHQKCSAIYHGDIMLPREKARLQCQLDSAAEAKTDTAFVMLLDSCDEQHSFQNSKD